MPTPAILRVCANCEWIFKSQEKDGVVIYDCPQCGSGSYGARYVYGMKCYGYAENQKPWMAKKLHAHEEELKTIARENWAKSQKPIIKKIKFQIVKQN